MVRDATPHAQALRNRGPQFAHGTCIRGSDMQRRYQQRHVSMAYERRRGEWRRPLTVLACTVASVALGKAIQWVDAQTLNAIPGMIDRP